VENYKNPIDFYRIDEVSYAEIEHNSAVEGHFISLDCRSCLSRFCGNIERPERSDNGEMPGFSG
jgi:hypothetical protein